MSVTNFQNGISSFGMPVLGSGIPASTGPVLIVGTNSRTMSPDYPTISAAIAAAASGYTIAIQPGSYDEAVSITRSSGGIDGLCLVGLGNPGDVAIAPSATNAGALVNDVDDLTLINVGLASNGTGTALVNTGARLRALGCKIENDDGTGLCVQMTLGTVAQRAAHTKGGGADCRFNGCEFAWAASGLTITCTDYGAVTELQILNSWFHDLDTKHILETVGSGGSAAVMYNSLLIQGNIFGRDEAGNQPTDYIILNGSNANTGMASGNFFPTAINGGKNLVSTLLFWVSNFHTGGISTAQPS
jgi:hypothetical protein